MYCRKITQCHRVRPELLLKITSCNEWYCTKLIITYHSHLLIRQLINTSIHLRRTKSHRQSTKGYLRLRVPKTSQQNQPYKSITDIKYINGICSFFFYSIYYFFLQPTVIIRTGPCPVIDEVLAVRVTCIYFSGNYY